MLSRCSPARSESASDEGEIPLYQSVTHDEAYATMTLMPGAVAEQVTPSPGAGKEELCENGNVATSLCISLAFLRRPLPSSWMPGVR